MRISIFPTKENFRAFGYDYHLVGIKHIYLYDCAIYRKTRKDLNSESWEVRLHSIPLQVEMKFSYGTICVYKAQFEICNWDIDTCTFATLSEAEIMMNKYLMDVMQRHIEIMLDDD